MKKYSTAYIRLHYNKEKGWICIVLLSSLCIAFIKVIQADILRRMLDVATGLKNNNLLLLGVLLALAFIADSAFFWTTQFGKEHITQNIARRMRTELCTRYLKMSILQIEKRQKGDYIKILQDDVLASATIFSPINFIFQNIAKAVFALIYLFIWLSG
jgi:ABC-type multidrug transport system fused ATPase/permease subunit